MEPSKIKTNSIRCPWAGDDSLYQHYHDTEWGVPKIDDQALFEKLCLEGFQAGLSWITVLRKREHFRKVFDHFVPEKLIIYDDKKIAKLMHDPGIIRNKLKIEATISNAKTYLALKERQSLGHFFWKYIDGIPVQNSFKVHDDIPAQTELSEQISKDLKKLGFRFCGPTIVYAFMQSIGMVNDHLTTCHRYEACVQLGKDFKMY
ncbi:MAG: DNA-3-methyladenine glycosylase I [Pseudomonadota bacterium]